MHPARTHWRFAASVGSCLALMFGTFVTPGRAQILSGSIINYAESTPGPLFTFGDGTHSVTLSWSVNNPSSSGYFYRTADTEVAVASGVSALGQIKDASIYQFKTPIGPVFDVPFTGGVGSFVVLRNPANGFYGIVRLDNIFAYNPPINHGSYSCYAGLNATWWFQANGTADFTPVPEPSVNALLLASACAFFWVLKKRRRCSL